MLIRLACDAYKAVSCICFPLLSIGVGLCLGGEGDGEGAFGVGVGVEGARDDVEHATSAVRALHGDEVGLGVTAELHIGYCSIQWSGVESTLVMAREQSNFSRCGKHIVRSVHDFCAMLLLC